MIKLIKESNDNKHNMLREDSIDDILEPQTYYIPDVWEDWKFDVVQAAKKFGLPLDNLDYDNNSETVIVTVDGYDRLGFEKYRKLYNWVVKNVYPEQNSYNFDEGLGCIKEELRRGRYWVTDDDYIPLPNQPEEGYTKLGAIERAQREAERVSKYSRRTDRVSVSDAAKRFHIMDSDGNIVHELDSAI